MDAVFKKPIADSSAPPAKRPTREAAEEAVRTLIAWAGDNPDRPGLIETPKRVVDAYREFYAGYDEDATGALERTFDEIGSYDDMVVVRDIPFSRTASTTWFRSSERRTSPITRRTRWSGSRS